LNPNRQLVAAPAVRAKVLAAIGKRVAEADRDDIAQSAYVRLLMMPAIPANENELLSLAVIVVRGLVVDHHRKRKVRENKHAPEADVDEIPVDTGEVSAAQREEWRQTLEFVEHEVAGGRVSADVLRWAKRLAAGDSFAQIAADERVPVSTVKAKMLRAREHLRKRWPLYASAAGALLIVVWIHEPEPVTVGHSRPPPESTTAPSMAPSASAPAAPLGSSDYRDKAARECRARAFEACERDLDLAQKIDPASESLPEVKAMRREIDRSRHAPDAKPE
jgi:DNA-directed RNA polymerase specialized sigma24 family protein